MITGSPVTISSDGANQRDSIPCQRLQPVLEYHMQPSYMLKRILNPEFILMEKNMSINLSLVKMPHSNFKSKATEFEARVGRCSSGQTFECASERELAMKHRMHHRFCSNPLVAFDKISVPKKACMMREQQLNEAERIRKVHN